MFLKVNIDCKNIIECKKDIFWQYITYVKKKAMARYNATKKSKWWSKYKNSKA